MNLDHIYIIVTPPHLHCCDNSRLFPSVEAMENPFRRDDLELVAPTSKRSKYWDGFCVYLEESIRNTTLDEEEKTKLSYYAVCTACYESGRNRDFYEINLSRDRSTTPLKRHRESVHDNIPEIPPSKSPYQSYIDYQVMNVSCGLELAWFDKESFRASYEQFRKCEEKPVSSETIRNHCHQRAAAITQKIKTLIAGQHVAITSDIWTAGKRKKRCTYPF